ncbi:hypothetical protein H4J58_00380, partial [Colwellia sp. MB3u-70]
MKSFLSILSVGFFLIGCAGGALHNKQLDAVKSEARYEYSVSNEGFQKPIARKGNEISSIAGDIYPQWVMHPASNYEFPVGIACEPIRSANHQSQIDARADAIGVARLQLFQKLSGDQRVSAREKYVNNGSEKKIQIEIKTHSRGLLPANKKIKESII